MENFIEKVEKIKMIYRVLILAATILALGAFFYFVIYSPFSVKIEKNKKEIKELDVKILDAKKRERQLAKFEAEQAKSEEQLKEQIKLLPNESEIPDLLRNISALGIDSGLEFVLFSPKKEVPKDFYYEIPVSIEVVGKYHDVAAFFYKVGQMDRIVNIQGVSMRPKQALSATLNTTCSAVTFKFKPKGKDEDQKGKKKKRKKKPKKKKKKK
jgi:type IV pilus assembly protein PilO